MIGKREVKDYRRSHLPVPERKHLHVSVEPDIDTIDEVQFNIKFASNNAHLSSTVFLERNYTFVAKNTDVDSLYFNVNNELNNLYRHANGVTIAENTYIRKKRKPRILR